VAEDFEIMFAIIVVGILGLLGFCYCLADFLLHLPMAVIEKVRHG